MVSTGMWWILLVACYLEDCKIPQKHNKICSGFNGKGLMVHNRILMKSFKFLWWFLLGFYCFFSRDSEKEPHVWSSFESDDLGNYRLWWDQSKQISGQLYVKPGKLER